MQGISRFSRTRVKLKVIRETCISPLWPYLFFAEMQVVWWRESSFHTVHIMWKCRKNNVIHTLHLSVMGLDFTLSMNEIWFSGCQSFEYTTRSKGTVSKRELMTGITSEPSWPAGQFWRFREPTMKSFWTSTTTSADTGFSVWKQEQKSPLY